MTLGLARERRPGARAVSAELVIGLGLVVLSLSLIGAMTITRLARATERYQAATRTAIEDLLLAERLRGRVDDMVAAARGYLLADSGLFLAQVRQSEATVEQLLEKLNTRAHSSTDRSVVAGLRNAHARYREFVDVSLSRRATGAAPAEIAALFERDLLPRRQILDQALEAFVATREARLSEQHREVAEKSERALTTALTTLGIGTGASVLLAALFAGHLARVYRRERRALAEAERATAARDEMLAIVAHDLRSPLHAIALRAGMLRDRGPDEKTRAQGEAIRRVVATADRLAHDMLDVAKMDAGGFTVEVAPCPARELLQETVELFNHAAAAKKVQLECDLEPADLVLEVDRERATQVLANLVGNALKFAPSGTSVRLVARSTSDEVHLQIADRGPGIPPGDVPHIFERFWKGRGQGGKGSGLGLYIASKIVEAHRGRIWVDSFPDQGTVFHVVLPRSGTPCTPSRAAPEPALIAATANGRA